MKRLRLFIGIGIILPIAVIVVFYYRTEPIYVAAFLGAWPAFAIALYNGFVNVPLVTFDKENIRKILSQLLIGEGPYGIFLDYLSRTLASHLPRIAPQTSGF